MKKLILIAAIYLAILQCTTVVAQETISRLHLDIAAWLRRQGKDDDSWKGRTSFPYDAYISHASVDPKLTTFTSKLSRFKQFRQYGTYDSVREDYLESLFIENTTLTAEQARHLEPIATERFMIRNCDMSDEVAESLGRIRCKERIRLHKPRLSDKALTAILTNQNGVEAEGIQGCTAEGWRGLTHLTSVSLIDCDFPDDAFPFLSECVSVELRNAQVTGMGMESLKSNSLRSLVLTGCPITDEGLKKLGDLPELVKLDLSRTAITDIGLQYLPELPKLRELNLSETSITDEWLRNLPKMPKLSHLNLCGTTITDEGFRNIVVPPELQEIRLTRTKVTSGWGVEFTRKHPGSNPADPLRVDFLRDPRWPPLGGLCIEGEFHLYR